jgi:hypothetical protein|tara:strand:+ start:18599 stop:19846 length:1248 start_codon:yes stop_codon:yes gene_type:complete
MVSVITGTDGAAGGMRSIFDSAYTERLNVSEFIDAIDPRDIPLLSMLGMGSEAGSAVAGADSLAFPCINPTHTWQSDELIPSKVALNAADTSSPYTTIDVGTVAINYFKVGDLIELNGTYGEIDASSINTSAGTFTVTVVDGSAALVSQTLPSTVYNLGNLRLDGETFTNVYASTAVGSTHNYTQIFHDAVSVSGTSEATEKFGITGEFDREFAKKFQEVVIKLERAAHYGLGNSLPSGATANTDRTNVRRMGGLFSYIKNDASANVTDASSAKLTEKLLVDSLQDIWDDGGNPDTILVNATQKRVLSSFASPYVRTDRGENALGIVVGTYESEFGDLDIVLDRYVKPADLIILQKEYIGIGALKGNGNDRSFFTTPVPVDGDRQIATITGEYTMEVRNADKAHGWIHSLSTTLS